MAAARRASHVSTPCGRRQRCGTAGGVPVPSSRREGTPNGARYTEIPDSPGGLWRCYPVGMSERNRITHVIARHAEPPRAPRPILPRPRERQAWHHACRQATLSVSYGPRAWTDVSSGVCLRWSVARSEATDRRDGHACERHARASPGVAGQPDHGPYSTKKKAPALPQVHKAALQPLLPAQMAVEIWRDDGLAQHRGLTSERDTITGVALTIWALAYSSCQ